MGRDLTLGHVQDSDHVQRNRASWDEAASEYAEQGRRNWTLAEPTWGIWGVPESDVGVFPDDLAGLDGVELGCGTGYVSAWLARRGTKMVGIDNSSEQLRTAARLQQEFGLPFPILHADAECVPFADGSFDLAISEYGASIWADPYRWIPEAARVLRPGGRLIFLVNGTIFMLCAPDEEDVPAANVLIRDYFGMHRFDWPDDPSIEFHLGYGDWIRLLRANGFEIEDLIEIRPPEGSTTRYPHVTLEWSRRWPCEEVWKVRKRG
jgi:SAM-dependent methyltransferase